MTTDVLAATGLSVYAGATPLVQDVTLTIGRGERVGLILSLIHI